LHSIEGVFRAGGVECSAVRVDAYSKDNKLSLAAADRMGRLTGIPIAIACELFAKGKIRENGSFASEAIIPTKEFLNTLISKGIKIYKEVNGEWKEINF